MDGIPPVLTSDSEDVVWALQTAEALWKRGERVDAIVWLRRAAQAAGEAEDDNRAVVLARNAAELTDWVASHTMSGTAPIDGDLALPSVDELLGIARHQDSLTFDLSSRDHGAVSADEFERGLRSPSERPRFSSDPPRYPSERPRFSSDPPPRSHANSEAEVMTISDHAPDIEIVDPTASSPAIEVGDEVVNEPSDVAPFPVPSAEELHAGMLDPWAEAERQSRMPGGMKARPPSRFDEEEVVTSARPRTYATPPPPDEGTLPKAPPPPIPKAPPPMKPRVPPPRAPARALPREEREDPPMPPEAVTSTHSRPSQYPGKLLDSESPLSLADILPESIPATAPPPASSRSGPPSSGRAAARPPSVRIPMRTPAPVSPRVPGVPSPRPPALQPIAPRPPAPQASAPRTPAPFAASASRAPAPFGGAPRPAPFAPGASTAPRPLPPRPVSAFAPPLPAPSRAAPPRTAPPRTPMPEPMPDLIGEALIESLPPDAILGDDRPTPVPDESPRDAFSAPPPSVSLSTRPTPPIPSSSEDTGEMDLHVPRTTDYDLHRTAAPHLPVDPPTLSELPSEVTPTPVLVEPPPTRASASTRATAAPATLAPAESLAEDDEDDENTSEIELATEPRGAPAPATALLDFSSVEALGDLPDDARVEFARVARIETLAREEEVANFALALVLEGELDVASPLVDAAALRLEANAILRSRGTLDDGVQLRLVCATDTARVAIWDDAAVSAAFRTCPWVEEDLRVVADGVQTKVGVTMGPLGERFDMGLREHVTSRLKVRNLAPGEQIATQGKPTPGIVIVGVGEIDLFKGDAKSGVLRSGDILFPGEVLSSAPSPASARGGKNGALVLFGDRMTAQELLMSFPPLLEILAS